MDLGDTVRIKQPFQPDLNNPKTYEFAVVAGFVEDELPTGNASPTPPPPTEVVVFLFDPKTTTYYRDEMGTQALFSFRPNELEET